MFFFSYFNFVTAYSKDPTNISLKKINISTTYKIVEHIKLH